MQSDTYTKKNKKNKNKSYQNEYTSELIDGSEQKSDVLYGASIKNKSNTFVRNVSTTFIDNNDFKLDCPNQEFVPTVIGPVERIIVIGDIHGDLNLAIRSFKLAKLINDEHEWIAEPSNTVVIQVGDQIDGCRPNGNTNDCHNKLYPGDKADDMEVIDFFDRMHILASATHKKDGTPCFPGAVYSLFGNHELMNVEHDFRYVSYANYHNFNYEADGNEYIGTTGRYNAFKPGGGVAKKLACSRKSVMVIGSNMFVHAGVLPALVDQISDVDFDSRTKLTYLNAIVRKWLLNKMPEFAPNDVANKALLVNDTTASPFWTRIYGQIKPGASANNLECQNSVSKALKVFKIGKIVVGHTPQLFTHGVGINGTCHENNNDGNLWRVDGGFSKAFGAFGSQNIIQVLEILNDKDFKVMTETNIKPR